MANGRVGGLGKLDPAVVEFQKRAAQNPQTVTRKQRQDRKRVRVNFDVPLELKAALEKIADMEHEDTSMAQVAALLLSWATRAYIAGEPEVRALFEEERFLARTPKFAYNIDVPQRFIETLRTF